MQHDKLSPLEDKLREIISYKTIQGNRTEFRLLTKWIHKRFKRAGLHATEFIAGDLPLLVATTRETKTPTVLFLVHIDVIDADKSQFDMQADERMLFGRGVWDMKFALAGCLQLIEELGRSLTDFDIGFAITCDEESYGEGATELIKHGFLPKCAVVLDGSNDWQLESLAKGMWQVEITTTGKAVHGSRPWEGKSASMSLLNILEEVRKHYTAQAPESETLNISRLSAGMIANQIPAEARATLDFRFVSEEQRLRLEHMLDRLCAEYDGDYFTDILRPAIGHDLNNQYLAAYAKSAERLTGNQSAPLVSYGGSDATAFHTAGVPCIVTRPLGSGHHSDSEWVDRTSLALFVPLFRDFLKKTARA